MTSTTQLDRIDELNRRRAEASEREAARDAEQERKRRADPTIAVAVPTIIDAMGAEPAAIWPQTDDRTHRGSGLRAGSTTFDRVLWGLTISDADRPKLIAVWADGATQWYSPAVKLNPRHTSTVALTFTVMASGRVTLHCDELTAAQVLDRMDARADRLGEPTPDARGDSVALAHWCQGPPPVIIPRLLADHELLLARLGQAVSHV